MRDAGPPLNAMAGVRIYPASGALSDLLCGCCYGGKDDWLGAGPGSGAGLCSDWHFEAGG